MTMCINTLRTARCSTAGRIGLRFARQQGFVRFAAFGGRHGWKSKRQIHMQRCRRAPKPSNDGSASSYQLLAHAPLVVARVVVEPSTPPMRNKRVGYHFGRVPLVHKVRPVTISPHLESHQAEAAAWQRLPSLQGVLVSKEANGIKEGLHVRPVNPQVYHVVRPLLVCLRLTERSADSPVKAHHLLCSSRDWCQHSRPMASKGATICDVDRWTIRDRKASQQLNGALALLLPKGVQQCLVPLE